MVLSTVKLPIKFLSTSILQAVLYFWSRYKHILLYYIDKLFQKCKIQTGIQNIKTNLTVDTWLFVFCNKYKMYD